MKHHSCLISVLLHPVHMPYATETKRALLRSYVNIAAETPLYMSHFDIHGLMQNATFFTYGPFIWVFSPLKVRDDSFAADLIAYRMRNA